MKVPSYSASPLNDQPPSRSFSLGGHQIGSMRDIDRWVPTIDDQPFSHSGSYHFLGTDGQIYGIKIDEFGNVKQDDSNPGSFNSWSDSFYFNGQFINTYESNGLYRDGEAVSNPILIQGDGKHVLLITCSSTGLYRIDYYEGIDSFSLGGHQISSYMNLGNWVPTIDGQPFAHSDSYHFFGTDGQIYGIKIDEFGNVIEDDSNPGSFNSGADSLYINDQFINTSESNGQMYMDGKAVSNPIQIPVGDNYALLITCNSNHVYSMEYDKVPASVSCNNLTFSAIAQINADGKFYWNLAINGRPYPNQRTDIHYAYNLIGNTLTYATIYNSAIVVGTIDDQTTLVFNSFSLDIVNSGRYYDEGPLAGTQGPDDFYNDNPDDPTTVLFRSSSGMISKLPYPFHYYEGASGLDGCNPGMDIVINRNDDASGCHYSISRRIISADPAPPQDTPTEPPIWAQDLQEILDELSKLF
ncbi:MAG: hypothetical protein HW387_1444 [Parachlamydiales bacterium]|nr:hypothetical protein [Parachlamydiales bacterium]